MPYMIVKHADNKWCVHEKSEDDKPGENRGCSETEEMAQAHMRALYVHHGEKVVKALDNWQLDVLGVPFGDGARKDSDGEFFDGRTDLAEDHWGLPPAVYYHGFEPDGRPSGTPTIIGKTVSREKRADGVWYRVVLDQAKDLAKRVWQAAKDGAARASSGSIAHLKRVDPDGHIRYWPVVELSLLDAQGGRQPANGYAVAVPVMKAIYREAGLPIPAEIGDSGAASKGAESQSEAGRTSATKSSQEHANVDEKINEAVAAALKAYEDRQAAAAAVVAEKRRVEELEAEVKRLRESEAAKSRLPGAGGAPAQLKIPRQYDNLSPAEHSFMLAAWDTLYREGKGFSRREHFGGDALKALIAKTEAEAPKSEAASRALKALGAHEGWQAAIKANEINYSTLANYGDEWIGVQYSTRLWESIRAESWVLARLESQGDSREIPQGYESDIVPLESTDPVWYKVAQATAHTSGRPDVTVTASKVGTAQRSITVAKMGCRVTFTGELVEDSLIDWVPNAMRQIRTSGAEMFEHAIIDGDTETGATTNINDIGGTPAATDIFMLVNGFRKLALVTNTANSRDGGALTDEDFLETVKLMGVAGKNAADPSKVTLIPDAPTYWKSLTLAQVKTRDVFANATIENGQLTRIYGYEVKPSWFMNYAGVLLGTVTTATYQLKSNTAGKVDQDTEANNTKGAILAVRFDQWALRWKRRMTLETDRWPESDTNQLVAMTRWGLAYRDTDASAVSYNLTV